MTLSLFNNRLAPLTYSIGFLNAPITDVASALTRFISEVGRARKVRKLSGSLENNLLRLQPLTGGNHPSLLLSSTTAPGWTAVFDADAHGQGVAQDVSMLAEELKVRGYYVASALPSSITPRSLGGRQFRVLGPETMLGTVRSIDLIENDPDRWHFAVGGEVQTYENLDAYANERYEQRFTEEMLLEYTAAVGLRPWDENFYTSPSYLITNTEPPVLSYTLDQARKELGLPPTPRTLGLTMRTLMSSFSNRSTRMPSSGVPPITEPLAQHEISTEVSSMPPRPLDINLLHDRSVSQREWIQQRLAYLRTFGACDLRVDQQQVSATRQRVGINRPDIQYTLGGQRFYEVLQSSTSQQDISSVDQSLSNDSDGTIYSWDVD